MKNFPSKIIVDNEEMVLGLFRVNSFYEDGTIKNLTHIPDDVEETLESNGQHNVFILGYISENTIKILLEGPEHDNDS